MYVSLLLRVHCAFHYYYYACNRIGCTTVCVCVCVGSSFSVCSILYCIHNKQIPEGFAGAENAIFRRRITSESGLLLFFFFFKGQKKKKKIKVALIWKFNNPISLSHFTIFPVIYYGSDLLLLPHLLLSSLCLSLKGWFPAWAIFLFFGPYRISRRVNQPVYRVSTQHTLYYFLYFKM